MPSSAVRCRARLALVLLPLVAAACIQNPAAEARQQELNIQLGDAVNELRQAHSDQQAAIDSLRMIVAKQDTTLQRMAAVTGVPIAK